MSDCITSSQDILDNSKCPLHREEVEIKSWGKTIWLRELTMAELLLIADRDDKQPKDQIPFPLLILKMCAQTPEGQQLFSDEDIEALKQRGGKGLFEAANEAARINKLQEDAQKELEKNSDAPQTDSSLSA